MKKNNGKVCQSPWDAFADTLVDICKCEGFFPPYSIYQSGLRPSFGCLWTVFQYWQSSRSCETEFIDSVTQERILAILDDRQGRNLAAHKGITKWGYTKDAFLQWSKIFKKRISDLHEHSKKVKEAAQQRMVEKESAQFKIVETNTIKNNFGYIYSKKVIRWQ